MTHPNSHQDDQFHQIAEVEDDTSLEPREQSAAFFVEQIKETADKLLRDNAGRGNVKLLNTAFKELRYAFKVFARYADRQKVSVFGSARLPLDHPASVQAIEFGKRMAEAGFMVITGAANGIMEAGHVGAGRDASIGVNILLPFEANANPVIVNDSKLMHFKYFFTRKLLFVKESDAVVLFPGGFGTLDEGFETLTLLQTGKSHMFPIVMVAPPGDDFWIRFQKYIEEVLLGRGMISEEDLALFKVTDSVDEAVEEVLSFYRVYHSMRFVGDHLVLRLKKSPPPEQLESLNEQYGDILVSGKFEVTEALPAEANEPELADLPRLRFHFNKRNHGTLRKVIDSVNRVVE